MKKTKNVVISILVLLVGLAGLAMTIAGMFGKFNGAEQAWGIEAGKHFDLWKAMASSDVKNFMGVTFFGGIVSLVVSLIVTVSAFGWVIKSVKGDYNIGFIKFVGLLILAAFVFAISIAVIACANKLADPIWAAAHLN